MRYMDVVLYLVLGGAGAVVASAVVASGFCYAAVASICGLVCDSDFGMLDFNAYNDFQCRLNDQIMGHSRKISGCMKWLGLCLRAWFLVHPDRLYWVTLNTHFGKCVQLRVCQLSPIINLVTLHLPRQFNYLKLPPSLRR